MVEIKMVKANLTDEMINTGLDVLKFLDKRKINISTALWFYSSEAEKWHLILASSLVRIKGPRYLYKILRNYILKIPNQPITLRDIKVVDINDSLIKLLNLAIRSDSGVRFTNNYINNYLIEDAFIYRSK